MFEAILGCGALVAAISFYYTYRAKNTPIKLFFVTNPTNLNKVAQCPTLFKPLNTSTNKQQYTTNSDGSISTLAKYTPCWWLLNEHAHNIWAAYLRKFWDLPYKRDLLTTADGGTLSLDWFDSATPTTAPTILILHGLTGGSYERYVQHFALHAMNNGFRCVVMNYRGAYWLQSKRTYCGANTEDFRFAIDYVKKKIDKSTPLFAAGFSLGSIIMTKYLSEIGSDTPFVAAVSLSNPMDMNLTSQKLNESFVKTRVYSRHLAGNLTRLFSSSKWVEFWEGSTDVDMTKVLSAQTLRDVDVLFTAPAWGYKRVEDYYADACTKNNIHKVRTPLLCVNAADDPLAAAEGHPYEEFKKNPYTVLALTQWGAHLGFLEKEGLTSPSFADKAAVEWLLAHTNK